MRIRFGFGLPGPFYVSGGRRRRRSASQSTWVALFWIIALPAAILNVWIGPWAFAIWPVVLFGSVALLAKAR